MEQPVTRRTRDALTRLFETRNALNPDVVFMQRVSETLLAAISQLEVQLLEQASGERQGLAVSEEHEEVGRPIELSRVLDGFLNTRE